MKYYDGHFKLKDIEKEFEGYCEYCKKIRNNDLEMFGRFRVIREFQDGPFLLASKSGVMNKLRNFIEFHHPIIFKIRDQERECDILEISLMDSVWTWKSLDWKKGKYQ